MSFYANFKKSFFFFAFLFKAAFSSVCQLEKASLNKKAKKKFLKH